MTTVRASQGVDCLAQGASFTQRRVFAFDGVGYVRSDVGAPAPQAARLGGALPARKAFAPALRAARGVSVWQCVAMGLSLGGAVAAVLIGLGVL